LPILPAWDVIKISILAALNKLRSNGLTPSKDLSTEERVQKQSRKKICTELDFLVENIASPELQKNT
jgi:hypothetical protein